MCTTARLFQCTLCARQTFVCSHCDRGHQYCSADCSDQARRDSLKRANQKYNLSRQGQHNNALRQRRYRQRHQQKVTDQGSPLRVTPVSLPLSVIPLVFALLMPEIAAIRYRICHFCHRQISAFVRNDFLHRQSVDRRR